MIGRTLGYVELDYRLANVEKPRPVVSTCARWNRPALDALKRSLYRPDNRSGAQISKGLTRSPSGRRTLRIGYKLERAALISVMVNFSYQPKSSSKGQGEEYLRVRSKAREILSVSLRSQGWEQMSAEHKVTRGKSTKKLWRLQSKVARARLEIANESTAQPKRERRQRLSPRLARCIKIRRTSRAIEKYMKAPSHARQARMMPRVKRLITRRQGHLQQFEKDHPASRVRDQTRSSCDHLGRPQR